MNNLEEIKKEYLNLESLRVEAISSEKRMEVKELGKKQEEILITLFKMGVSKEERSNLCTEAVNQTLNSYKK